MSATVLLARRLRPGARPSLGPGWTPSAAIRPALLTPIRLSHPSHLATTRTPLASRASSTLRANRDQKIRRAKLNIVEAMVGEAEDEAAARAADAAGIGAELSPKEQRRFPAIATLPAEQRAQVDRALELLDKHPSLSFQARQNFDFPRRHSAAVVDPNYWEDNEDNLQLSPADKHTVAAASKGWYPGHQRMAERNMPMLLRKARAQTGRLPLVVEVRDARIPITGINPVFERMLQLPNPKDILAVRAAAAARGEIPFESVLDAMKSLGLKYKPSQKTLKDLDLDPVLPLAFARLVVYTRADLIDPRLRDALREGIERKHREFGLPKAYGQVMFVDTHKDEDIKPVVQWLQDRARELAKLPGDVSNWFTPRYAKGAFRGANEPEWGIRAVALGMPNAGKSSLVNAVRRVGVNGSKSQTETHEFRGTTKVSTPVRVTGERRKYGFAKPWEGEQGRKRILDKLKFERLPEEIKYEQRNVPPVYIYDTPGINLPYLGAGTMALHRVMKLALVKAIPHPDKDPQMMAEYILFKLNRQYNRQVEIWRERQRIKLLSASPEELEHILEAPGVRVPRHLADLRQQQAVPAPGQDEENRTPMLSWETGSKPKSSSPQLTAPPMQEEAETNKGAAALASDNTISRNILPTPESSASHSNAAANKPVNQGSSSAFSPSTPSSSTPTSNSPAQAQPHPQTQSTSTITLEMPQMTPEPETSGTVVPGTQDESAPAAQPEDPAAAVDPLDDQSKDKLNSLAPWMRSSNRELDLFLDKPPIPDYSRFFRFKRPPPPTNVISQFLTKLAEYTPQGFAKGGTKKLDTAARYFVKRAMGGWMSCVELDMQPWDQLDAGLRAKIEPRQGRKLIPKSVRREMDLEEKLRFQSLSKDEQEAERRAKLKQQRFEDKLDKALRFQMRRLVHNRLDAHVARELRRKEEKRGRFQLAELEQDEYEGRHGVTPGEARGSAPGVPSHVQSQLEQELNPKRDTADERGLVVSHASHGMPTDNRMTLAADPGVSPRQLRKRWKNAKLRRNYRKALEKGYKIPLRTLRRAGLFKMTRSKRSTRWLRSANHTKPIPY